MFFFQKSAKEKLRFLRKTHNLSSAQLSELLYFKNKGSVSHLELGKAGLTLDVLENIVQLFAISPNWMLGLENLIGEETIMSAFQESFYVKLRFLRETHKLSTKQLTDLLNLKSKGSIAAFESGKATPLIPTMKDISQIFSVSLDWLINCISGPYREEIIESIENSLIADRDKDDEWLAYYRLSSWMTGEDIYADSVKRAQSFSLPVRANMIFALQVLRHTSIFFHSLQSKASFNGIQLPSEAFSCYPAFHRIFYPMTVAHEGKRKANIRWNHCSACYDLLLEYIKGSRDRNRPVFDICKSGNKENAVSPRHFGEYEKNLSEPDKSEYAVSPLLCGENGVYQKCKKGAI